MALVSDADKRHMARLGAALDEQLRQRRRQSAGDDPGANITAGLMMSDEILAAAGVVDKPLPQFSLSAIWKKAQLERNRGGPASA